MKKWIARIALGLVVLTFLSGVSTYLFVRGSVVQMFGGNTATAEMTLEDDPTETLVITNARVLNPMGDAFLDGQSVVLKDGSITYVGENPDTSDSDKVIDAAGQYLIPGFVDSHVHLWRSENDLLLYLANGVTLVREMHGIDLHLKWRDEIEKGRLGPDLFVIAAQLATYNFAEGVWVDMTAERNVVRSDKDVRNTVEKLKNAGYDGLKASSFLSGPGYQSASRETAEQGLPLVGHLPVATRLDDLWESNQSEVAHIEEFVKALDRDFGGYKTAEAEDFLNYVRSRSADVAEKVREKEIVVTTTLALVDSFASQIVDLDPELRAVELEYVNPGIAEGRAMGWLPGNNRYSIPESYKTDDWEARYTTYWNAYAEAQHIMFEAFLEAGVTMFAGTDANVPVMVPGFSLHDEMQAMQAAGMTPAQVLASSTRLPAQWMGRKAGQISEGFEADLVLVRNNPLEDIAAAEDVETVFSNGHVLTRPQIDDLLTTVREANEESRQRSIQSF